MPSVQVVRESSASPERVLAAARDFSPRRADYWRDVHTQHLVIHDEGETWADVTEGNPWPGGLVWERLRYDWSRPGVLKGTVIDSNLFKPGSTWEIRATPTESGGSRVEISAERHLKGRGRLLWPLFPLGLARRDVAAYLQQFLESVEATRDGPRALRYVYRVTVNGEPDDQLLVRNEPVTIEAEVPYRGRTVIVEEIEDLHGEDAAGSALGERLEADPDTQLARTLICQEKEFERGPLEPLE